MGAAAMALRKCMEARTTSTDMVPIVMEIELQSSLPIGFDHDYFITGEGVLSGLMQDVDDKHGLYQALHLDAELADISWTKLQTAGIHVPATAEKKNIPPSWIKTISAPRFDSKSEMLPQDFDLLVAAGQDIGLKMAHSEMSDRKIFAQIREEQTAHELVPSMFDAKAFFESLRLTISHSPMSRQKQQLRDRILLRAGMNNLLLDRLLMEECQRRANIDVSESFQRIQRRFQY